MAPEMLKQLTVSDETKQNLAGRSSRRKRRESNKVESPNAKVQAIVVNDDTPLYR